MTVQLIVGLGNPGREYVETRHNAGFLLIDRLVASLGATPERADASHLLWSYSCEAGQVFLMKPLTYMNLSGQAVASFMACHPLEPQRLLVVYDDVALALGRLRLRPGGSAGGQKGMKHIIETLGTKEIPRLRFGIDSNLRGGYPLHQFVLQPFGEDEVPLVRATLDRAQEAATLWSREEMTSLMGRFNADPVSEDNDPPPDRDEKMEERVE